METRGVLGLQVSSLCLVQIQIKIGGRRECSRAAASKNLQCVLVYFSFVDKMPDGTVFIVFSFIIQIFCGIGGALATTAAVAFLAQCFADNLASIMVSKMLLNELLYHCFSCRNFVDK